MVHDVSFTQFWCDGGNAGANLLIGDGSGVGVDKER